MLPAMLASIAVLASTYAPDTMDVLTHVCCVPCLQPLPTGQSQLYIVDKIALTGELKTFVESQGLGINCESGP